MTPFWSAPLGPDGIARLFTAMGKRAGAHPKKMSVFPSDLVDMVRRIPGPCQLLPIVRTSMQAASENRNRSPGRGIGDVGRVKFTSDTTHYWRFCSKSIVGRFT